MLKHQQAFVDRMLSISLQYDHVLYCMDNETNEPPEWGEYWARYIRGQAEQAGKMVEVTEMWDAHDVLDEMHQRTWKHPETYSFCDISQNNHQKGEAHWNNAQAFLEQIRATGRLRPVNCVKIYGADTGRFGTGAMPRSASGGTFSAAWRHRGFTARRRASA